MTPVESVDEFIAFAATRGIDLKTSVPREGIDTMLAFHAAVPCSACSDDTLLYQWGTYDWGAGKFFELNITRQFIEVGVAGEDDEDEDEEDDEGDDHAISQLSLTYRYRPGDASTSIPASNLWEDGRPEFRQFIDESAAFVLVADAPAEQVDLYHSYV